MLYIRQKGFSFVELVSVLLLLAIVSVFAFAKLDINPFRSAGFEQELRAALRFAQKFAMVSGCDVQVQLNAGGNSYALFIRDDAGSGGACLTASGGFNTPLSNPATGNAFSGTAPAGVNLGTTLTFFYDRQGRPSGGGAAILIDARSITVEANTGFVH